MADVRALPDKVKAADRKGRVDLRDVPLVTIDGEDARDFDDAVYCEPIRVGRSKGWRLLVAIADVSHYVRSGGAIDVDAFDRATSVYFPRRIVAGGKIENVYRLQLMNAAEQPLHFELRAEGLPGLRMDSDSRVRVAATESQWISVRLQLPYDASPAGSHPISFAIRALDEAGTVVGEIREKSVFLVPR